VSAAEIRIWCPPQSPLRIEYSASLPREIGPKSTNGETSGVLFGLKQSGGVRVVSTRRSAGLEAVGAFFARPRGEVFLTEDNLRQFERLPSGVALVIAGNRAGFFVRDAAGSIQTIQSYEEFAVTIPSAKRKNASRPPAWAMVVVACLALLAIPLMASPYLFRAGVGLVLHEDRGQIILRWNPAVAQDGSIEIIDGAEHATIALSPQLASVTYMPRTNDVEVVLTIAGARRENIRYRGRLQ
jgi:hypothetical protein